MGIDDILILGKSLRSEHLDPLTMGSSTSARYIPVYAHRHIFKNPTFVGEDNEVIIFGKLNSLSGGQKLSYDDILTSLTHPGYSNLVRHKFDVNSVRHSVGVYRGYLCDENKNILMVLTYRGSHEEALIGDINPRHLRLFVSKDFLVNPIYKNLYKRLYTDYILRCIEEDVEVLYLKSEEIEARVFSNQFKVEFNSITELMSHLSTEVAEVFAYVEPVYITPSLEDEESLVDSYADMSVVDDLPF